LIPADLRASFFFHPGVVRVMEALPCQMFGDQAPSCVSSCCRLWCSHRFTRAGARPGVFQDTSGEKEKISHGNQITPPLQTHTHTHTLTCSHNAKTPGRELTDAGSSLHDLTKPGQICFTVNMTSGY